MQEEYFKNSIENEKTMDSVQKVEEKLGKRKPSYHTPVKVVEIEPRTRKSRKRTGLRY